MFTLRDGVVGDDTVTDGTIVDAGGPGYRVAQSAPVMSWRGLALTALGLLGFARRPLRVR